jgi:LysM repeat protein
MYIAYSNLNSNSQGSHSKLVKRSNPIQAYSKKALRYIIAISILVIICSFGVLLQVNAVSGHTESDTAKDPIHIIVERGDTLWGIASTNLPAGKNVRSYVELIKKTNTLNSSILKEGQVLFLPEP